MSDAILDPHAGFSDGLCDYVVRPLHKKEEQQNYCRKTMIRLLNMFLQIPAC